MKRPKIKPSDALPILARRGADGAVELRPKTSETAIRRMQLAAKRDLGEAVPDSYVALLRITNGVQINGAYFKEAENLVRENLDLDHPQIIVLGADGNMAHYVYDKRDRCFHTIHLEFPDEPYKSYGSFEEMLIGVLKEQHVLRLHTSFLAWFLMFFLPLEHFLAFLGAMFIHQDTPAWAGITMLASQQLISILGAYSIARGMVRRWPDA